jgi:hypothetical protein
MQVEVVLSAEEVRDLFLSTTYAVLPGPGRAPPSDVPAGARNPGNRGTRSQCRRTRLEIPKIIKEYTLPGSAARPLVVPLRHYHSPEGRSGVECGECLGYLVQRDGAAHEGREVELAEFGHLDHPGEITPVRAASEKRAGD